MICIFIFVKIQKNDFILLINDFFFTLKLIYFTIIFDSLTIININKSIIRIFLVLRYSCKFEKLPQLNYKNNTKTN